MCGLWGPESSYAKEAKELLEKATRENLDQQPPAKKLAGLRAEHQNVANNVLRALHRCDQIEEQMAALQQEYYDMEAAAEAGAQRARELQGDIDTYEAGLPTATTPGEQLGVRERLQNVLQAYVRQSGQEFTDSARKITCDSIEVLLQAVGAPADTDMREHDQDDDAMEDERAPKQPRTEKPIEEQADAADDDAEWERGLGAVGKKLVRRGVLGKRLVLQMGAMQVGQGGKNKGKGTLGKGKGKAISYSAAVQTPPPVATVAAGLQPNQGGAAASSGTSSGTGMPGSPAAAQVPIDAQAYAAHQAQLRRGEGFS
jgi:hypothetical protein